MVLLKKVKKISKVFLSLYVLSALFFLFSNILLTINLSYLVGIETFLRIFILTILYLILAFYSLYGFVWLFQEKKTKLIIFSVIIILISSISLFGSYYINKTYRIIDNINKDFITYTTNLITLSEYEFKNDEDTKIGMISDVNDVAGHILAKELIKKEKLDKINIISYDDYISMIEDLYNEKINGFFIASNYKTLFTEEETYSALPTRTTVQKEYSKKMKKIDNVVSNVNINKPFTLLLLGIDSTNDGLEKNSAFNGDSIMLITFNPKTLSTTILSIPRDTYVPITCRNNKEAKINAAAISGASCMVDTITQLTGIKIDYYVKMNFVGVVDLVNALGGVYVDVPYSFCEQDSQRRWGDNTIYLEKGYQKLNGEQSLALARNRHFWPTCGAKWNKGHRDDFVRGQNQQLIVQGMISKIKDVKSIDSFYKILSTVSKNMDTNMSTNHILSFYEIGKKVLVNALKDSKSPLKIDKLYLQTSSLSVLGSSTQQYQNKSLEAVVNAMKVNLDLIKAKPIKTFNFNANEPYEIELIGKGLYDKTQRKVLRSFIDSNKDEAISWCNSNGIKYNIIEVKLGDKLYNEAKANNIVVKQSVPKDTLLENIDSVDLYVQTVVTIEE